MKLLLGLAVLQSLLHAGSACSAHDPVSIEAAYKHLAKRASNPPLIPKTTVINNVQIFDGQGMTMPRTVILKNGVITYVGPAKTTAAEVTVNAKGKYLIPGLIDSHCHIESPDNLDTLASYGVTTAVNMACLNYKFCSMLMNTTGTTSMITASLPAVGDNSFHAQLTNTPSNETLSAGTNTTAWVEQFAFPSGAPSAFLKVTAEPSGPSQGLLNSVVASARQLGHYAVMHASYFSAYEQAVAARPRSIQHIPTDKVMPDSMAKQIAAQEQFVTPTMAIFRIGTNSPQLRQLFQENFTWSITLDNAKALYRAKVPLLAGTDATPFTQYNFTLPFGLSLHCELEFLTEAGMSPAEALRAATIRPATIQGALHDRGSIVVGKRADLVLLNKNPMVNISNTRNIARVWAGGIEVANVTRNLTQNCAKLTSVES